MDLVATGAQRTSLFWVGATSGLLSRCCECELLVATDPLSPECCLPQEVISLPGQYLADLGYKRLVPSKQNQLGRTVILQIPLLLLLLLLSRFSRVQLCATP